MQQIAKTSLLPTLDHLSAADPAEAAIRTALADAGALTVGEDFQVARLVCTDMIARHQVRIAHSPRLLAQTVATLAAARGMQALTRLMTAVSGRQITFTLLPQPQAGCGTIEPAGSGRFRVVLSEPWLADTAAVARWSHAIAASVASGPRRAGPVVQAELARRSVIESCRAVMPARKLARKVCA